MIREYITKVLNFFTDFTSTNEQRNDDAHTSNIILREHNNITNKYDTYKSSNEYISISKHECSNLYNCLKNIQKYELYETGPFHKHKFEFINENNKLIFNVHKYFNGIIYFVDGESFTSHEYDITELEDKLNVIYSKYDVYKRDKCNINKKFLESKNIITDKQTINGNFTEFSKYIQDMIIFHKTIVNKDLH